MPSAHPHKSRPRSKTFSYNPMISCTCTKFVAKRLLRSILLFFLFTMLLLSLNESPSARAHDASAGVRHGSGCHWQNRGHAGAGAGGARSRPQQERKGTSYVILYHRDEVVFDRCERGSGTARARFILDRVEYGLGSDLRSFALALLWLRKSVSRWWGQREENTERFIMVRNIWRENCNHAECG